MRTRPSVKKTQIQAITGGILLTTLIAAAGCSTKPSGIVVGAGNDTSTGATGNNTSSGGSGNNTSSGGSGISTGGTGTSTGGTGTSTGGTGIMAMGTCTDAYTAPHASMIGDPKTVLSTVTQLTVQQRIDSINGGP
jgi:hypothetical protein